MRHLFSPGKRSFRLTRHNIQSKPSHITHTTSCCHFSSHCCYCCCHPQTNLNASNPFELNKPLDWTRIILVEFPSAQDGWNHTFTVPDLTHHEYCHLQIRKPTISALTNVFLFIRKCILTKKIIIGWLWCKDCLRTVQQPQVKSL